MKQSTHDEFVGPRATSSGPVPACRGIAEFAVEQIGSEFVLLHADTLHYHTMNREAAEIWDLCDGTRDAHQIAKLTGQPVEIVGATVAELGEAELLQSPPSA